MTLTGTTIDIVNGVPSEKIVILAMSWEHFKEWCFSHDINPRCRDAGT